jgi:hypothetical protein
MTSNVKAHGSLRLEIVRFVRPLPTVVVPDLATQTVMATPAAVARTAQILMSRETGWLGTTHGVVVFRWVFKSGHVVHVTASHVSRHFSASL